MTSGELAGINDEGRLTHGRVSRSQKLILRSHHASSLFFEINFVINFFTYPK